MNNGLECDAIDFFSLQCFINAVQFNSAFNLVCSLECEASHPVSDGSLSGKKASHPTAQIPSVRGNVPVLLSDSQQKRLGGGSPPGWSGRSCTAHREKHERCRLLAAWSLRLQS